jgi:hypothetical protein
MFERKTIASLFLSLGLLASPAPAQQSTQSEHHPGGTMSSQAMPGGGSMMGQGGIPMMRMMMDEGGMGGMPTMAAMTGHVEGRLAFLKPS